MGTNSNAVQYPLGTNSNIFHDFLVEEFKKKTQNVDIVDTKRKYFKALLNKANSDLRDNKIAEAKQSYFDIIEYLKNEPYHDELNLSLDVEFCIKCCFCYSSVTDSSFCQERTIVNILTEELVKTLQQEFTYRLFPKYLEVLLSFKRNDWIMTLYWCNAIATHKEEDATYKSVDFFKELLPTQSEINAKVKIYEEKAFYGYGQKLANNLWCMKNAEKKITLCDDSFHSEYEDHNMTAEIQQYILKYHPMMKDTKIKFEEILNKLVDLYQSISKCSFIESIEAPLYDKIREIEDLVINNVKKKKKKKSDGKNCVGQTQTDKIKSSNRHVQTEGTKCKNVEVQVNIESQVLSTLLDIKHKMLVSQEKKDDTINKLNKKISELHEKVTKETNKRKTAEEDFQQKLVKHQYEIKTLKDQLRECDNQRKQECDKNISLQKLLVEQINDKYNMEKSIYKTFEKKSVFMITYLRDINQFLTPNSIPNDVMVKQNIDIWDRHLNKIQEGLNQLNLFYKKVRIDMINSEINSDQFNISWPEIPEFPRDEDNIVFVSFKPAIKNIIDIEEKLLKSNAHVQSQPQQPQPTQISPPVQYNIQRSQYPMQQSSFFIGPRLIYPNLPQPITVSPNPLQQCSTFSREKIPTEISMHRQQSLVEQNPNLNKHKNEQYNRISKSTESINKTNDRELKVFDGNIENATEETQTGAACAKNTSEKDDKNYQEKEKVLFGYVLDNCSGATEDDVTFAMLQVLDDNKGTLSKLSKEQIVEEVKLVLRIKKQSAWVAPKSPLVDWKNDHSEHNCSICFEEFSISETYTLHCQHEYHKECIRKWLKTSSVCPICRIHSVIDDEFPPLH